LPKESKKKKRSKSGKGEKEHGVEKGNGSQSTTALGRDYFCTICFEAFRDRVSLDEHMKTHRELEVTPSACRMEAQPAGVF
jgi:hypothetical protein